MSTIGLKMAPRKRFDSPRAQGHGRKSQSFGVAVSLRRLQGCAAIESLREKGSLPSLLVSLSADGGVIRWWGTLGITLTGNWT